MNLKKFKKKLTIKNLIFVIYGIITLWTTYTIHKSGLFPFKYELIILLILWILYTLLLLLAIRFKKGGRIFVEIISVLLSIILALGSVYLAKGSSTIANISGANKKTYTMSVVVMNDSSYERIEDLENQLIGINTSQDTDKQNATMEQLKETLSSNVRFSILSDNTSLVNGLYDGSVQAIVINEAYRSILEVEKETFSDDTRVIWSYEIDEDMIDVRKSVNVVNTPFTVYVSGIDTYGPISTVSRTDVNMLVTVNPNTKQIVLTSIPRDAWVELDNMKAYDKLTHSGIAGIENSINTIENFMGVEINYYARVNFSSVVAVVDALGGIDVYSDMAIGNYIQEGMNHLNGTGALSFARERHAYDFMYEDSERGDQRRVENQQAVIEAVIKKMISPAMITHYNEVLSAVEGMFETNLSASEINDLISMQIDDMASWDFKHLKVTGHYEYQYGGAYMPDWHLIYYITDPSSVNTCRETIDRVLDNKVLN